MIKENEKGGACGTYQRQEKRLTAFSDMIQNFWNPDRLPAHLLQIISRNKIAAKYKEETL